MIIRNSCLFIHIPKTGGTSVRWAMAQAGACYIARIGQERISGLRIPKHHPHLFWDSLIPIFGLETLRSFWCFTVARNPWARLVSDYTANRKTKLSFRDYARHRMLDEDTTVARYLATGEYDYVAKMETLARDWRWIAKRVGAVRQLPQKNGTPRKRKSHKRYQAYYDDETRELVAELEKPVIEGFGYTFE